jgi:hypothetical protein
MEAVYHKIRLTTNTLAHGWYPKEYGHVFRDMCIRDSAVGIDYELGLSFTTNGWGNPDYHPDRSEVSL